MAKKIEETPRMKMGCDLLDILVGGDKGVYGLPFGSILNLYGDSASGKAAPLDTKVLTPNGWKLMGDIKVGDTVVTPYRGQYAKVLGVYPQGERDVYRFYFNDNSTVESADSHYWVVQSPNQYNACKNTTFGWGKGHFLVTTKELAEVYKEGTPKPANVVALPTIEPVEYAPRETPKIPPYLMGILIAEGSLGYGTPTVTLVEPDIIEKVLQQATSIGMELHRCTKDIMYSIVLSAESSGRSWLPAYIRELGLDCKSIDKHIPEQYLYGTVTERIELLHGMFDGDGTMTKQGCASYSTSSKQLAQDVADLARSLGLRATMSKPKKTFYTKGKERYPGHDSYTVYLTPGNGILPFSSKKHTEKMRKSLDGTSAYLHTRRRLQTVEYVGKKPCQCIYIDHPMHLYLMDNFVPTHNTFVKNEIIAANYWALGGEKGDLVWESDDCESGDTFDTTRLYGFDIHPEERRIGTKRVEDSGTVEELDAKVSLMIEAMPEGKFGIYAVDSIDGLSDATREAMETGRMNQLKAGKDVQDPGDYGAQIAKFLSQQFFRTKHKKLEDAQISLIIVSQVRENMGAGMYAPKTKTGNGKALEFYCHTRIQLKTVAKIMKNDRWVGSYVKATTIKSKTPRPFRDVFYTVYFDYGIDNVGSNLDYLFDLRNSKGELIKSSCEHIAWSADAKSKDLTTLKEWLEQNGWTGDCKADRKAEEGSNALSVDWILRWASSDPDRKSSFEGYFGQEYTREELVRMCDSDKEMAAELTRRVRQKWEAAEDAVATGRPSKYGN